MSDFAGMEELLQDFLLEAGELLSQVDNKLVELEKRSDDKALLNDIFRGFHTIKGGAGFLNVEHLVTLCHRTENLFDKLRNGELPLTPELMDSILAATGTVRDMFGSLSQSVQPDAADPGLLARLDAALSGESAPVSKSSAPVGPSSAAVSSGLSREVPVPPPAPAPVAAASDDGINWD
ncbi:MAG: Hpt domain-containing protein, partial [Sulfurimonas sp.]|nr:Hpt domain-containing protein [Sulfurimonas sp.]